MERMYIVVNSDLSMGKGKVAAQVGHGVAAIVRHMENCTTPGSVLRNIYKKWSEGLEMKIVVKAPEDTLLRLATKFPRNRAASPFCIPVLDAGRTQVPEGSLTVVAFAPLSEKLMPEELKSLQLL